MEKIVVAGQRLGKAVMLAARLVGVFGASRVIGGIPLSKWLRHG